MNHINREKKHASEELPSIFSSWNQLYIMLLAWQGLLILFFYIFMMYFS